MIPGLSWLSWLIESPSLDAHAGKADEYHLSRSDDVELSFDAIPAGAPPGSERRPADAALHHSGAPWHTDHGATDSALRPHALAASGAQLVDAAPVDSDGPAPVRTIVALDRRVGTAATA